MSCLRNIIPRSIIGYLKWIEAGSDIAFENLQALPRSGFIAVFWHGDSLAMNLVLRRLKEWGRRDQGESGSDCPVIATVTADRRGDTIEEIVRKFGGESIRFDCNERLSSRDFRLLKRKAAEDNILSVAMDGPLGPLHQPKELPFSLSRSGGKPVVGVQVTYRRVLRLNRRWDRYAIPLPGGGVRVRFIDFGKAEGREGQQKMREKVCQVMG